MNHGRIKGYYLGPANDHQATGAGLIPSQFLSLGNNDFDNKLMEAIVL